MSRRALLVFTLLVAIPGLAWGQGGPAAPSIDGVWKVTEVVTTGANAETNSNPQPSLVMFLKGYYTYLSIDGSSPRPAYATAKNPSSLTNAEKVARYEQWEPFTAQGGTYEIMGTTITRHALVAKNMTVMTTNPPSVQEFKLEGNTLTLVSKSPAGKPTSETRTKLTRIQ